MAGVIDMQFMRYLNLFSKVTRVTTSHSFKYNETIFFCVPEKLVSKAIGKNAINIKQIHGILNKKIKVIRMPNGIEDAENFIKSIIDPVVYKGLIVKDTEIVINASTQSKASLIGRNKRRLIEMQHITRDFFRREFRVA